MKNKKILASCVGATMGLLLTGHVMAAPGDLRDPNAEQKVKVQSLSNTTYYVGIMGDNDGPCLTNGESGAAQVPPHEIITVGVDDLTKGLCFGDGGSIGYFDICDTGIAIQSANESPLLQDANGNTLTCLEVGGTVFLNEKSN